MSVRVRHYYISWVWQHRISKPPRGALCLPRGALVSAAWSSVSKLCPWFWPIQQFLLQHSFYWQRHKNTLIHTLIRLNPFKAWQQERSVCVCVSLCVCVRRWRQWCVPTRSPSVQMRRPAASSLTRRGAAAPWSRYTPLDCMTYTMSPSQMRTMAVIG